MNRSKTGLIWAAIFALIFSAGTMVSAEVKVSADSSAPDKDVIAASSVPESLTGYQWRNNDSGGRRDLGQSFKAAANGTMTAFSVAVAGNVQVGAYNAAFTVTVYESDRSSEMGKAVSTQKGTYLDRFSNPINPGWITFELEAVSLTGGKYYTIIFSWDNLGIARQDQVFASANHIYSDGRLWESADGKQFKSSTGADLVFCVQGK